MTEFNKNLSLLNPTSFVNDVNYNAPLKQLLENDEYILKFLNGNRIVLKSFLGNLLDFNATGEKILSNGGRFNTYKKCHTWKALKSFAINNDEDIIFDETNEMMVYKGYCDTATCLPSYNVNRETWIEREIFIPEILRGQQIVFGIKASAFETSSDWDLTTAQAITTASISGGFETIAVEIMNGEQTIREFKVVGPWDIHNTFEHVSSVPEMITAYIPFRVKASTKSVKVKIFRTVNDGYLHINKMFLGAVTLPYDNDVEEYGLENIDINNFYDYDNDVAKVTATTVTGHKVARLLDNPKQNDLLLMWHMYEEIRKNWTARTILSGTPNDTLPEHGILDLDVNNRVYTITHHPIQTGESHPQVTLVAPTSGSSLFVQAIFDVQDDQFSVVLSDFPTDNNYKLSWFIPTIETADIIDQWTITPPTPPPTPTVYPDIFDYENEY
jgi:hypothetical protein